MFRFLFWVIVIGVIGLMLDGDLPIPGIGDEEVVYTATPPVSSCGPSGCLAVYTLEAANVGRSAQESVRVRLRGDAIAAPAVAPMVRRSTDTAPAVASEHASIETFSLGHLAPEERVALVFVLRPATKDAVLGWERVLVGVDPTLGASRPGDTGAVTIGRIAHSLGRVVQRLVAAVRALIASPRTRP